ncbi:hypothetical protein STIAU_4341, partial [Stigmatella aurantiaca DW4/3-1]
MKPGGGVREGFRRVSPRWSKKPLSPAMPIE